jgi:hypothetical protein
MVTRSVGPASLSIGARGIQPLHEATGSVRPAEAPTTPIDKPIEISSALAPTRWVVSGWPMPITEIHSVQNQQFQ